MDSGEDLISMEKNPPLVACKMITRPKSEGGLGIIKLRSHYDALLMKFLH
jgi:hypothetical protein